MNQARLENAITEQRWKKSEVAEDLQISASTLHRKLKGESPFTVDEIRKLQGILKLSNKDLLSIFFSDE